MRVGSNRVSAKGHAVGVLGQNGDVQKPQCNSIVYPVRLQVAAGGGSVQPPGYSEGMHPLRKMLFFLTQQ